MANKIVIDPVTRIEGHLRIEAKVDGGRVTTAYSSGTMFRGMELILKGRDPREAWIWAQRICGVCTTVHAHASVYAVEDVQGLQVACSDLRGAGGTDQSRSTMTPARSSAAVASCSSLATSGGSIPTTLPWCPPG